MQKADLIRLRHMLDAARHAEGFIKGKTRNSLDSERQLALALVKSVEIIGEAASRLTRQCREELSQIPWLDIVGMRNRLIHAYFDIDLDTLWQTVIEDLPPLIAELDKVFEK